jgi:hypothetical protein
MFVLCGRCEDNFAEVETRMAKSGLLQITVESLIDLKAEGWEYDGISWCCPACSCDG